ncbi:ATP-binding protein [Defluviimonas sp. 20V17]|uniref:tRNA threonylcarbamoyladenosine biosynthesis protein TsaE n=1 Tax=Allgaiera indica TaxID=765699 RepID=A0AAN4UML4_9RHOB|nr:tRNA (adenosine(37)-N6)-threonylcarbamoyltransferase complex ATPase subunit type 1 TsaE [Allgaiera indica]KDB03610.1 ATP-binding protein [Defluviimonas sp. 20V17]GHD98290.1 tRNA (adenosine(37)-N6)-threonylcarbamoyltransferase complex ATPase subunit type 1 TsaE [Allgaiera indica]SDW50057.1 tRNA threonylcarbamoyladenosine biosynthesis protein TsaE [Allgaiera indica]
MSCSAHLTLPSPEATANLARRLGNLLSAGDVVLLAGPIGAGKTHFARALIQSRLAVPEDVPSPTFTLVQTYEAADGTEIWHADLYRLTDPTELFELGLDTAFDDAICLIEWPDRLGPESPADALHLTLGPGPRDDARRIAITGPDRWAAHLVGLGEADA